MCSHPSVTFTGLDSRSLLLSSAPPTESESNILRAFEAGWAGVVTKTIGLHPVVNVVGAKAKFMRTTPEDAYVSMKKRPGAALHSSWNWELISDKTLDWWLPRIRRIKQAFPDRILIASIMAGSGNDKELQNWQRLARDCQDAGADGLELNFSCPHMDRRDMGSNIGKDQGLCSVVTEAVKEVATAPVCGASSQACDGGDRGRGSRLLPGRRRRHRLLQHLPIDPTDRSRDPRIRDQRGRVGIERRPRRAGDPSAVAGEDGPDNTRRSPTRASRGSAGFPTSLRRSPTSCWGAAPCRCARPPCSTRQWPPTAIKRLLAGLDVLSRAARGGRVGGGRELPGTPA